MGTGGRRSLGRPFGWLWASYTISTFGTWIAFDAFPLIAILVLDSSAASVSLLAAAGLAVGALVAVPLGPWVEFRRKRRVMIAMDLTRFVALISVALAYVLDVLTFAHLLVAAVTISAAGIASRAASGAAIKAIVEPDDLLVANARLESTHWTATAVGPPLGGAAIGVLGPVTTVVADAASYVLSALGIRAMGSDEERPARESDSRMRAADLIEGWHYILGHPTLRLFFFNTILVSGLILATAPLLAVLMLGELGFEPWQYGLAFALPCLGGLLGSRLSRRLVARHGRHRVMLVSGTLRACWSVGLAFVVAGTPGLLLVMAVQFGIVTSVGVFNPIFATYRLQQTESGRVARTLTAWAVSSSACVAALTALWGVLAAVTTVRVAIGAAGLLMLATPLLLPRRDVAAIPA